MEIIERLTLEEIIERYPLTEQEIKKLKEMTKYYTPEIEEFHVGFEYEIRDPDFQGQSDEEEWKKKVFDRSTLMDTLQHWKFFQDYRVKCLDEQDIKECGWKKSAEQRDLYSINWIDNPNEKKNAIWMAKVNENKYQITDCRHTWHFVLFVGTIKNKSELKRIMKMICIDPKD